jgi:hypothetical protein
MPRGSSSIHDRVFYTKSILESANTSVSGIRLKPRGSLEPLYSVGNLQAGLQLLDRWTMRAFSLLVKDSALKADFRLNGRHSTDHALLIPFF